MIFPCPLLCTLKIVAGVMLLKSKLGFAIALLKTLPRCPISPNIRAKSLTMSYKSLYDLGTRSLSDVISCYSAPPPITLLLEPTMLGPTSGTFHRERWQFGKGAGRITRLRYVPSETCRLIGTVVWSLNFQLGMSEWRKGRVGFGQSKVLLGKNDGKRRVRTLRPFL